MPQSLPQVDRVARLNRVPKATPAKANVPENEVHSSARLLRQAIDLTGMNQDEAMTALGFTHKGQFSEALDGKRKLWAHQLLRASAICAQLLILKLQRDGTCQVERVIKIKESA